MNDKKDLGVWKYAVLKEVWDPASHNYMLVRAMPAEIYLAFVPSWGPPDSVDRYYAEIMVDEPTRAFCQLPRS